MQSAWTDLPDPHTAGDPGQPRTAYAPEPRGGIDWARLLGWSGLTVVVGVFWAAVALGLSAVI